MRSAHMLGWNHSLMAAPVVLVVGVWWFHSLRRNQPRRTARLVPPLTVR